MVVRLVGGTMIDENIRLRPAMSLLDWDDWSDGIEEHSEQYEKRYAEIYRQILDKAYETDEEMPPILEEDSDYKIKFIVVWYLRDHTYHTVPNKDDYKHIPATKTNRVKKALDVLLEEKIIMPDEYNEMLDNFETISVGDMKKQTRHECEVILGTLGISRPNIKKILNFLDTL